MSDKTFPHREAFLQWIWANLEFEATDLQTIDGQPVSIVDNGKLNNGAGPDFLAGHVRIDGISHHGNIEIHTSESHWRAHGHQNDPAFNSVVLHVVYQSAENRKPAYRKDGTQLPLLVLKPFIKKPLQSLLNASHTPGLPCGNQATFINQHAFEKQIEFAHREYFNLKVDEFLTRYDPSLPPSEAWKLALINNLFIGLGISQNRISMGRLFNAVHGSNVQSDSLPEFSRDLLQMAFAPSELHHFNWIESGMRPASQPSVRIEQAAALYVHLHKAPFRTILKQGVDFWNTLYSQIPPNYHSGKQMKSLLFYTVFLPAIYLIGDLFQSEKHRRSALNRWAEDTQQVPAVIQKPFTKSGFSVSSQNRKLGMAHQLKRYCHKLQCYRCEIFKNAISS